MQLHITQHNWPIDGIFRISRGSRTQAQVIQVELSDGSSIGRGECVPYARYNETLASVSATIEGLRPQIVRGLSRGQLAQLLPAGAARNAVDCALWDLECKQAHQTIWQRLSITPHALTTAYTLSLDTPEQMQQKAQAHHHRPLFKLKLAGDGDLERVKAVRQAVPNAQIIIDANEGWNSVLYQQLVPELVNLNVAMIEQPFPAGDDALLQDLPHPIALCADESCHDRQDLVKLKGCYEMINIKIDKTGGLTEALALKQAAEAEGFAIMVGCMVGTSLAMAPAFVVAQNAKIVDLDGPLLLAQDQPHGFEYDQASQMQVPSSKLWG
ncbi:N-acetyl-D-Glu racemase DgcA [Celerinatantimonas yamalensis]|uniref:Dipeptide epimerase n=1 Tax=Celerinatantimonas yamalensis TaxID=559956 RepID=A0ABW9G3H5_9GAMM